MHSNCYVQISNKISCGSLQISSKQYGRVPGKRNGLVKPFIIVVQSQLQKFVIKLPNLGIMGGCKESGESKQVMTATCQSGVSSGGKRRYCEIEDRETGGQPNKAPKHNLLPGINKH